MALFELSAGRKGTLQALSRLFSDIILRTNNFNHEHHSEAALYADAAGV